MSLEHSNITGQIINICFDIHNELGPGFREKIYHTALEVALEDRKIKYQSEKEFYIKYKDRQMGVHRVDMLVESEIIIELKAIKGDIPGLFIAQTLSYLKAANKLTGLIINFGNQSVNIKRLYNKKFNNKISTEII